MASNRLPVSVRTSPDGAWSAVESSGGLASALSGVSNDSEFLWVGWPGCPVPSEIQAEVTKYLADRHLVPIFLRRAQEQHFYHGICNQVLWPLFHYFTDKVDFQQASWEHYVEVNEAFAARIAELCTPSVRVWVHDFHLMLVPELLRRSRPDLEIGFFLHIPFPSSEIYRLLPAREDLITGLLGADYIGFHTHDYARHFRASCLRVLGLESDHNSIAYQGRRIGVGVHPIGIDVNRFDETLADPKTSELFSVLEDRYRGRRLILGVERLDYTKGVPLKLQAFERLLEKHPEMAKEVTLLQVLVPSRSTHPDYRKLKKAIEEVVGRLNGRYGGPGNTPVEYMHRDLNQEQLVALYRLADVGMVTPVRDGMNLVAQEFVLCQGDLAGVAGAHRGVLVLSEFAGSAQYLPRSLLVNPWDIDRTVLALEAALRMPAEDKRERMAPMVEQVRSMESTRWAARFLDRLTDAADKSKRMLRADHLRGEAEEQVRQRYLAASRRMIFLDYDGTLRELVRTPEEAAPTAAILSILNRLGSDPRNRVHLVSGRHRNNLETWFGHLPVHLCAEHAFAWRSPGGAWQEAADVDMSWLPAVQELLLDVAEEVPGTRLERKPSGLAWHYRMVDLDYGVWRARGLHSQLEQDLSHLPVEIVHGHRVIEVRAAGINKGNYVRAALAEADDDTFVLCMGDDRTDHDMYKALPAHAVSVHVGGGADGTRYTMESPARVRAFLAHLCDGRELART